MSFSLAGLVIVRLYFDMVQASGLVLLMSIVSVNDEWREEHSLSSNSTDTSTKTLLVKKLKKHYLLGNLLIHVQNSVNCRYEVWVVGGRG